jgi:hypothetical protein
MSIKANWPDWVRAGVVAISLIVTVIFALEYWALQDVDRLTIFTEIGLVGTWLGLMILYVSLKGPRLSVFAAILSLLTVAMLLIVYANVYRIEGIIDSSTHQEIHGSAACFYFSVVTFTTLGYGDFYPSPEARFYAASEAIMGYLALALFISVLGYAWNQVNRGNSN